MAEALTNDAANKIISTLKKVAKPERDLAEQRRRDEVAEARKIVGPMLAEARAIIQAVEEARAADLDFINGVLTIPFADVRRAIPVTRHGEVTTRDRVASLENSALLARDALGDANVRSLKKLVDQVEALIEPSPGGAVRVALEGLPHLLASSRAQPGAARVHVQNARRILQSIEADLAAGTGNPQTPPPTRETVPVVVKLPAEPQVATTYLDGPYNPFQEGDR